LTAACNKNDKDFNDDIDFDGDADVEEDKEDEEDNTTDFVTCGRFFGVCVMLVF
jgi:hypothetical protein